MSWLSNLFNNIAKLVDVKSIITFAVIGTVCFLAIQQRVTIPSELFSAMASSILTYFFARPSNKTTDAISNLPLESSVKE